MLALKKLYKPSSSIHSKLQLACRHYSIWSHLQKAPFDSNHATNAALEADPSPLKINLGRGVYKDDHGKNWKLPCIRRAEERVFVEDHEHQYLPFSGLKSFQQETKRFLFHGYSSPVTPNDEALLNRVATIQTISGTGALRVGAEFLSRFLPDDDTYSNHVYVSSPTYVNHYPVFELNGFEIKEYTYYDYKTNGLDLEGMLRDIEAVKQPSVFLLHACAHNPTGVDPTLDQWRKIGEALKRGNHFVFFDCAYQGFASGDPDHDAAAVRLFAKELNYPSMMVAQSYAKNFGLYGQRVGALNILCSSKNECDIVMSQLNRVVRPMYSNPPSYGARLVSTVFTDSELRQQWFTDVKTMANRIRWCREQLVTNLEQLGSNEDWSHITNQIGMFAYSGLKEEEVDILRKEYHVYLNYDGRMSISGINSSNVERLALAMHEASKRCRGK